MKQMKRSSSLSWIMMGMFFLPVLISFLVLSILDIIPHPDGPVRSWEWILVWLCRILGPMSGLLFFKKWVFRVQPTGVNIFLGIFFFVELGLLTWAIYWITDLNVFFIQLGYWSEHLKKNVPWSP